jgi:hypothetical protein
MPTDPLLPFERPVLPVTGPQKRDLAVKRVKQHANPIFWTAALQAGRRAAETLPELTTDDVWTLIPDLIDTPEHRAMGPVMSELHRAGIIEPTDHFRATKRPEGHVGPRRIWRSLLWRSE